MASQSVITREITVAQGVFAPGHLGELTQLVPFEMVDDALAQTGTVQSRTRDVPSRVVVYLLLAACLFPELGYLGVWRKLVAGLGGLPVASPSAAALSQARRRIGVKPVRFLFELLRGPAATVATAAVTRFGLMVCAIDGTTMTVPDSEANLAQFTKHRCNHGGSGYPLIRVMALVACGTRTVIDAVFGPTASGEVTYAHRLAASMRTGMLVVLDRNFGAASLLARFATTGAHVLVRLKNDRRLPVLSRYRDGSYLSLIGSVRVRIIECEITITTSTGAHTGVYRLATTLLEPRRYPACEIITLYHQRWEIETAYLELKSSILGGRVLRARTPPGVVQEVYALLITYQILRLAMTDATDTQPGLDPDRASFTVALHTARDQLIHAAGVITDAVVDLVGSIGRQVLANLLPDRRLRTAPRIVKRAISKYNARGPNINRTTYKATINIDILAPPETLTTSPET